MHLVGIRREDKSPWERRAPITPDDVKLLQGRHGVKVVLEPSDRRVFDDASYRDAGAAFSEGLHACPLVLCIKEVPPQKLLSCKTYLFFSHTIKGQPKNMPMLRRLMDLGCTLLDYECITDDQGRRLIFFGRHAGLAGMLDILWALGQRLKARGIETPLAELPPAHQYGSLAQALARVRVVGQALRATALPPVLTPLVFGVTGYGNVSRGAQEVLDILGCVELTPEELDRLPSSAGPLVKVVFCEQHLAERHSGAFDLRHYYGNPEEYRSIFQRYLPRLNVLMNCIYWDERYPRVLTLEQLRSLYALPEPHLLAVGDISCDVGGAVEATVKYTDQDHPVFVYDLDRQAAVDGFSGRGPVILAVDNLPAELPREASESFSTVLTPLVPVLAGTDFSSSFDALALPPVLKRAVIVHRGQLTPGYRYLEDHLQG